MIELRSNQIEPVRKGIEFFSLPAKKAKNSLIVAPTAFGKSVVIAHIAAGIGGNVIVLQPSVELLKQNYAKFVALGGKASIYSASAGRKEVGEVTFATIGSVFRNKDFEGYNMIVDEAHLYPRNSDSMFGAFMRNNKIGRVLGLTATPLKLQTNTNEFGGRYSKLVMLTSRNKHGTFYKEILHVTQISEMVELGFWSKLRYVRVRQEQNLLRLNSSGSEYEDSSVVENYNANNIREKIWAAIQDNPDRRHILVFVPSVEEARYLASVTPESVAVWGDMPKKERERSISMFTSGLVRTVFNVNVLSVGFDYTKIDMVVMARNTLSLAWYYQAVGRGTRIDPEKEGCLVVDLAGIVDRFGTLEDFRYEEVRGRMELVGSGGRVLTSVDIASFGTENEKTKAEMEMDVMPFGYHVGVKIAELPKGYLEWCIENFDTTQPDRKFLVEKMKIALHNGAATV